MNAKVEVYLPNMRGTAVTVGTRVHLLLLPNIGLRDAKAKFADHCHAPVAGETDCR